MGIVNFNIDDFIGTFITLIFFIIIVRLIWLVFKFLKSSIHQREVQLEIEKQNALELKQLNKTVAIIEEKLSKTK